MVGVGSQVSNGDVIKHCGGRAVCHRKVFNLSFQRFCLGRQQLIWVTGTTPHLGSIFWYVRHPEIQKEIDKSVEEEDYLYVCEFGRRLGEFLNGIQKCESRQNSSQGSAPEGTGECYTACSRMVAAPEVIIKNIPITVLTWNPTGLVYWHIPSLIILLWEGSGGMAG